MKTLWTGALALSLFLLSGCGDSALWDGEKYQTQTLKQELCEPCQKYKTADCPDCKVPEPTCYKWVTETVEEEIPCTVMKTVDKECTVTVMKPVVKKVPVKTYKMVEVWEDTMVKEPYVEEVPEKVVRYVPVKETYSKIECVDVPGTKTCFQETMRAECTSEEAECERECTTCIPTGGTGTDKMMMRYHKPKLKWFPVNEKVECPGTVCEKMPVNKERTVWREGVQTVTKKVKKYRIVPGKRLVKKKQCINVLQEKIEYEPVTTTRTMKVQVPVPSTRTVMKEVKRKIEVECCKNEADCAMPYVEPKCTASTCPAPKPCTESKPCNTCDVCMSTPEVSAEVEMAQNDSGEVVINIAENEEAAPLAVADEELEDLAIDHDASAPVIDDALIESDVEIVSEEELADATEGAEIVDVEETVVISQEDALSDEVAQETTEEEIVESETVELDTEDEAVTDEVASLATPDLALTLAGDLMIEE